MEMEALVERLENLILHTLNKDDIPVLTSMRDRLLYKKDLTEKQLKFLDVMEARSKVEITYVDMNPETNALIKALQAKILVGTSSFYWSSFFLASIRLRLSNYKFDNLLVAFLFFKL